MQQASFYVSHQPWCLSSHNPACNRFPITYLIIPGALSDTRDCQSHAGYTASQLHALLTLHSIPSWPRAHGWALDIMGEPL